MARSTLFAFLVLALLQVILAIPLGQGLIINRAAGGALRGKPLQAVYVNSGDLRERDATWSIKSQGEGAVISTLDGKFFLNASLGSARFMPIEQRWYFENAGNNFYKIKVPNQDFVLSWDENTSNVRLEPANGGDEQLWQVYLRSDYGRIYRQSY